MIGISTKTLYAIAAIHQLGLLEEHEQLNIKSLATKADAPEKFLGQILLELKKAHILNSTKGANGGYSLGKALHQITLKEVIATLESNAFDAICQTDNPTLKLFWEDKQQELMDVLDTPLSELQLYHEKANQSFNYMI
ncbi:MAG TPA: transcriptional regulator [Campylobacterales bacterium]|nr:transcriptional regulator [Campylobacterales bacterium]HHS92720.1 transcriptional regulator [Campylobacterales bacterium]